MQLGISLLNFTERLDFFLLASGGIIPATSMLLLSAERSAGAVSETGHQLVIS